MQQRAGEDGAWGACASPHKPSWAVCSSLLSMSRCTPRVPCLQQLVPAARHRRPPPQFCVCCTAACPVRGRCPGRDRAAQAGVQHKQEPAVQQLAQGAGSVQAEALLGRQAAMMSKCLLISSLPSARKIFETKVPQHRQAGSTSKSLLYSSLPSTWEVYRLRLCYAGRQAS